MFMTKLMFVWLAAIWALCGCEDAGVGGDDTSDDDTIPWSDDDDDDSWGPPDGVDVLWIVDSSNSMATAQAQLAEGFVDFAEVIEVAGSGLDYQMGVTTTQALPCAHDSAPEECVDSVGTAGRLRGLDNVGAQTQHPPTLLSGTDDTLVADFQALVDVGVHGSYVEVGLWIVAAVACATLELPYDTDFMGWETDTPWDCWGTNWDPGHEWADFCRCLPAPFRDYNVDALGERFLREDSALMVVIVSDEGDSTADLGSYEWPWETHECVIGDPWPADIQQTCGDNPDVSCLNLCKIDKFLAFFETLERRVVVSAIGPGASLEQDGQGHYTIHTPCNEQNSSTAELEFYLWSVALTGGRYEPLHVYDANSQQCVGADLRQPMADLAGDLIRIAQGS